MNSLVFDIGSDGIADQTIDWVNDVDIRMMLLKGAGQPLKTNATVAAVLAEANVDESDATAYSRQTLANKAVVSATNKTLFDADNVAFTDIGGTTDNDLTGILIYKGTTSSGDDATNVPIAVIGATQTTNGGTVTATKDATNRWFFLNNTGA